MPHKPSLPNEEVSSKLANDTGGDKEPAKPNLPEDVLGKTASYLGREANRLFSSTGAKALLDATRVSRLGPHLWRHIVSGNTEVVMEMLSKYPELIDYRGDVTTIYGHEYKDINALELALNLFRSSNLAMEIYKILCNSEQYKKDGAFKAYVTEIVCPRLRDYVAKGNQEAADEMLKQVPDLLRHQGFMTDYSGRTFNCTVYEYAYWAKDTYMCRMLEKYMNNPAVRADTLGRLEMLERDGLSYMQHDQLMRSAHFDLTPLEDAVKHYLKVYGQNGVKSDKDWAVLREIWVKEVGGAQRDVPAHIAHQYCESRLPLENALYNKYWWDASEPANLTRSLQFRNDLTDRYEYWFPSSPAATDSGLGFSFAICRRRGVEVTEGLTTGWAKEDLEAIKALDEVRTADLTQAVENLRQMPTVQPIQSPRI